MYGGNVCNTRAGLASDPITPQTVSRLGMKWKFTATGDISITPAVVGGQVYVADWGGMLYRLDAATGQVVWSASVAKILGVSADGGADASASVDSGVLDGAVDSGVLDGAVDGGVVDGAPVDGGVVDGAAVDAEIGDGSEQDAASPPEAGDAEVAGTGPMGIRAHLGLVIRGTPVVTNGLVIFGVGTAPTVAAVDQNTGALVWKSALSTHPFAQITSSLVLDNGRIYVGVASDEEQGSIGIPGYTCCSFRGSVAAIDATSGNIVWQTPTIDDATYRNADGTLSGFTGVSVWSTPTVDRKRKLLYVTTGNNYTVPASVDGGAPLPAGDHVESIVALDLATGAIQWSQRMTTGDIWTFSNFAGNDWDFGTSPNLFSAAIDGGVRDVVGAGQKSGVYWAIDADTHELLWKNQVGPGGHLGGIHWGAATDGARVYVGVNDELGTAYKLGGAGSQRGTTTSVGSWAALDAVSGKTLWQVANPAMTAPLNGASVNGPVAVVNGVVFGGSMDADGMMYAFDAASGTQLWSFKSGGTVYGGAAIADGVVYWGCGYPTARLNFGTPGRTLYAFALAQ
jgi:polyvinyl alcohol dehydrogenase (cytochrome)